MIRRIIFGNPIDLGGGRLSNDSDLPDLLSAYSRSSKEIINSSPEGNEIGKLQESIDKRVRRATVLEPYRSDRPPMFKLRY